MNHLKIRLLSFCFVFGLLVATGFSSASSTVEVIKKTHRPLIPSGTYDPTLPKPTRPDPGSSVNSLTEQILDDPRRPQKISPPSPSAIDSSQVLVNPSVQHFLESWVPWILVIFLGFLYCVVEFYRVMYQPIDVLGILEEAEKKDDYATVNAYLKSPLASKISEYNRARFQRWLQKHLFCGPEREDDLSKQLRHLEGFDITSRDTLRLLEQQVDSNPSSSSPQLTLPNLTSNENPLASSSSTSTTATPPRLTGPTRTAAIIAPPSNQTDAFLVEEPGYEPDLYNPSVSSQPVTWARSESQRNSSLMRSEESLQLDRKSVV